MDKGSLTWIKGWLALVGSNGHVMDKKAHFNFWYFVVALFLLLLLQQFINASRQIETISYSEFRQQLEAGNIESVGVADTYIRGGHS